MVVASVLWSGPQKSWRPQSWQSFPQFSPPGTSYLLQVLGEISLRNYTAKVRTRKRLHWKRSSGDAAPELQSTVHCRCRTVLIWGWSVPLMSSTALCLSMLLKPSIEAQATIMPDRYPSWAHHMLQNFGVASVIVRNSSREEQFSIDHRTMHRNCRRIVTAKQITTSSKKSAAHTFIALAGRKLWPQSIAGTGVFWWNLRGFGVQSASTILERNPAPKGP